MNIAPPGVCACSAYAGVVFTAFLQGRRTSPACFFPPSSSSSSTSSRSLLFRQSRRVDVAFSTREDKLLQLYHALTRSLFMANLSLLSIPFFHSSLLFLIPENDDAKEIFLPPRKINTCGSNREGWDLEGISARPFHHKRVLSCNHDLSRHVYTPVGIAAAYRGQGFLGIRGNTLERGWTVPRR